MCLCWCRLNLPVNLKFSSAALLPAAKILHANSYSWYTGQGADGWKETVGYPH